MVASTRKVWVLTALGLWAAGMTVISAYLLSGHLLTLPAPRVDDPILERAARLRQTQGEWLALHLLYADCGCSRRVVRHLERRGPSALAAERVVLVEPRPGDVERLEKAGFTVEEETREGLHQDFGAAAAPLLVLADPEGQLRYVGGYTDRKRGPDIEDLTLLHTVRDGGRPQPLPLFGCAVNTTLAQQVDPLGLR